ncbi:MAG TPA: HAMP domain-containing histidine kinase [Candidatus Scatomorpha merdigallinarum]|nr:HAMP domain-containing histidine kinase [Candidatus Scatomorpha merdigallinarum]
MRRRSMTVMRSGMIVLSAALFAALVWLLWTTIPWAAVRYGILALCAAVYAVVGLWALYQRRQVSLFADELCETLDALISGREVEGYHPYEDSLTAKVQGKLMQYFDIMSEDRRQSRRDKETIQSLVSDISHQVKTPIANIKMFTGILQQHELTPEKRAEFLDTMSAQIDKLDFLMQSLIKMSRLETGTFTLHVEEARLSDSIAQAISTVWAKAEAKQIEISVDCDPEITVQHDPKWTAEAIGNILDNAVKYTPEGGSVSVSVRPWQFYTRIDITDTGIGIAEEHYNDVFQRFYRAQEVAAQEGVGLGLYLANGIITRQKGYISVKSKVGAGTTFSVYLLS